MNRIPVLKIQYEIAGIIISLVPRKMALTIMTTLILKAGIGKENTKAVRS
jgi:hypothetical protein